MRVKSDFFNKPFVHLALIALLGLIAYSNTFDAPFVFDDKSFIQENPLIRNLKYFTTVSSLDELDPGSLLTKNIFKRRFISFLTFAVNYRVNGLETIGYHIVDITVHVLNAFLLYLLVILTFRTPRMAGSSLKDTAGMVALMTALIFVSHPVQTQAVTYITQRFALLATCFYLLSLTAYVRSRLSSNQAAQHLLYFLSFVFAATGMLTKEIVFTLPIVIALYELVFFEGPFLKRILRALPFMLTMLIIPYILFSERPGIDLVFKSHTSPYSRWQYLLTELTVIVTYIRLLFIPVNQNLDYDYPLYDNFLAPRVFLSFLLLFSVFCFACWLHFRTRKKDGAFSLVSFGLLWFFITVSVESSIIPTANLIFEHRAYLPSGGVFSALTTGVFLLLKRLKNRAVTALAVSSLILTPLVLSYAAYARNSVWESELSLWEDVVRKSPEKARGHNSLANSYYIRGLIDKAINHYMISLRLNPFQAKAHNNLGNAYESKGLTDKAIEHYLIALRLRPDYAEAHNNIGNAYSVKGIADKAIEHYLIALRLKPNYAIAYNNLGTAYWNKGLLDRAIEHYLTAVRLKPDFTEAHGNLGNAYLKKGLPDKAKEHFQKYRKLESN